MNYYPFGSEFCDGSSKNHDQKRKYNGKEFDNMHGLNTYDYGARQYNPVTARWDRMDPLAEKYYSINPYAYCAGNPIMFIDPDGKKITRGLAQINERGRIVLTRNETTQHFKHAMRIFAETTFGSRMLSNFTEKGGVNYGVKGNGKYANTELDIRVYQFKSGNEQLSTLGNVNGSFGSPAKVCGLGIDLH